MLKSRLTWHCHFIQKLESEPELEFREYHPFFKNIREKNNEILYWNSHSFIWNIYNDRLGFKV